MKKIRNIGHALFNRKLASGILILIVLASLLITELVFVTSANATDVYWIATEGQQTSDALVGDGTYLYFASSNSPGQVTKIDPSTMTTVSIWNGNATQGSIYTLAWDGTYLYAGTGDSPAQVIKINPSTMATVSSWTGATGQNVCWGVVYDGTYLYESLDPGKVIKINTGNMTTAGNWSVSGHECGRRGLTWDGTYIYTTLYGTVGVVKINPSNMTTVGNWTGIAANAITNDGTYLYAINNNAFPGQVTKIESSTMTTSAVWYGNASQYGKSVVYSGGYLYLGAYSQPSRVVQINSGNLTTKCQWQAEFDWEEEVTDMVQARRYR